MKHLASANIFFTENFNMKKKIKVRKFFGLISTFVEVTGEKLGWGELEKKLTE